jgi:hypothetical protein
MYTTSSVMPGTAGSSHRGRSPDAQWTDAACDNVAIRAASAERRPVLRLCYATPGRLQCTLRLWPMTGDSGGTIQWSNTAALKTRVL